MNKKYWTKERIIDFLEGKDVCDDCKVYYDDHICQYCGKTLIKGSTLRFIHGHLGYPIGHVMFLIHEYCYWEAIQKWKNKER